jgi:class 3 adenylate cyclase/ABC-type transport system substrate-binding protein/glutamine cyclotransferase
LSESSEQRPGANGPGEAESGASAGAEIRTVLIADIRGYTTFTGERGDEAAARLAERFAEITAAVVAERGGKLVELRGDEALVVFASSRQALRAAVELQAQYAAEELPRGVGIGIDAGEAVPVGDGYRGSALNLAARLCAVAGPGEILASDAVVHLAATVEGIAYVSARTLRVKGFAAPVRAVRVVPTADVRPPPLPRRVVARVGGRRLALLAAGLAGAIVATTALLVVAMDRAETGGSSPSPSTGATPAIAEAAPPFDGPGVAFLDPESVEPQGERLDVGQLGAVEIEYVDGAFWALALVPTALHRIDPASQDVSFSVPIGFPMGSWLVDGTTIWATDYEQPIVHKLDATTGRAIGEFRLEGATGGLGGIALGGGSLWIGTREGPDGLLRIDPATGAVQHRFPIFASQVAANDDVVWAAGFDSDEVHRIDPRTDEVTDTVSVSPPISDLLLADGFLWAANPEGGELFKIGDLGGVRETYSVPGTWYVAAGDGHVWAAGEEERRIYRIDTLTGELSDFEVGRSVNAVAEGEGQLAAVMPIQADDVLAGVTGDVLTVGTSFGPFEYTDPAISGGFGNHIRDRLEQATCAKLLNYPDIPPPEGWVLEPEVAGAMPEISADGLTYTFTIRDGFAFSPPSNEAITAETFRFSIERALSPVLGPNATGIEWLSAVEGAAEYHAGEADSVSGLTASGSTLTITLDEPDPMFLHKLAMPLFCPVPSDTATLLNGVSDPPIPRSGPYYFKGSVGGTVYHLERNPNYPGPREATFDGQVWWVLEDAGRLIARVDTGEFDLVTAVEGLEPYGPVDEEWGPESDAAASGDQRWFHPMGTDIDAVALNPDDPLLADRTIREAVGLALDEVALAEPFSALAATSLMSPALPAHEFTTRVEAGPDIEGALELMAGRTGSVRIGVCEFPGCQEWGRAVAAQLEAIGITAEVVTVEPAENLGDPALEIGIMNPYGGCPCMLPDSAIPLANLLDSVPPGWIPDGITAEMESVFSLGEPDRSERAAAIADRLVGEGLVFPFGWYGFADYYSERIGCQFPGAASAGINLVALCLKDDG